MLKKIIIGVFAVVGTAAFIKRIAEENHYDPDIEVIDAVPADSEGIAAKAKALAGKTGRTIVKVAVKASKSILSVAKSIEIVVMPYAYMLVKFAAEHPMIFSTVVLGGIREYRKDVEKRTRFWDPRVNKFWYAYDVPSGHKMKVYKQYRNELDPLTGRHLHSVKDSLDFAGIAVY